MPQTDVPIRLNGSAGHFNRKNVQESDLTASQGRRSRAPVSVIEFQQKLITGTDALRAVPVWQSFFGPDPHSSCGPGLFILCGLAARAFQGSGPRIRQADAIPAQITACRSILPRQKGPDRFLRAERG